MRFIKCPETLGSRLCEYRFNKLDILMPWKYYSCRVVIPWVQGFMASYSNLGNWKCNYSNIMRTATHRCLAPTKPLFGLLGAWKWDSSRVMRLLVEEYISSVEQSWRTEKTILTVSFNPPLQVNLLRVNHCTTLWQHEKVILQGLWDPRIKGVLLWLSYYSVFWRPENAINKASWDPRLKVTWLGE